MTLREYGQSIVEWWEAYLTEITTENVLDWSISNLVLTLVGGLVGAVVIMTLLAAVFAIVLPGLAQAWEKTGLPYTWVRLDEKFGSIVAAFIMVCGVISFLSILAIVLAFLEMI